MTSIFQNGVFLGNVQRFLSLIQLVVSFQVLSLVFDHVDPPVYYEALAVVNTLFSIFAFGYFVYHCNECNLQQFILNSKNTMQYMLMFIVLCRITLAALLLEMYIIEEDETYQFNNKTIFLMASILAFAAIVIATTATYCGMSRKQIAKAVNKETADNSAVKVLMKPYSRGRKKRESAELNFGLPVHSARVGRFRR